MTLFFLSERGERWRISEWLVVADRFVDVLLKSLKRPCPHGMVPWLRDFGLFDTRIISSLEYLCIFNRFHGFYPLETKRKNTYCKWECAMHKGCCSLRSRKHQWSLRVGVVDLEQRRNLQTSSMFSSNVQGRWGTVQLCNHFTAWGFGTVQCLIASCTWRKHMKNGSSAWN